MARRWNFDNAGKNCRPRRRRRLTRLERITGSIRAAEAEIAYQRRQLVQAQGKLTYAKMHLARLEILRERLMQEKVARYEQHHG
mgnify:CR=1 FL=1